MPKSSRGRPGCLICKARKVKCDNPTENCTPCLRMRLSCPGSRASSNTSSTKEPSTEHELSEIVNEAFEKAGRKRRYVGACQSCQVSKIRCSRDRPACLRCQERGIGCVYLGSGRGESMVNDTERIGGQGKYRNEYGIHGQGEEPDEQRQRKGLTRRLEALDNGQLGTQASSIPLLLEHDPRVRTLCETFFVHVHPLRCLSFIHKPSFMQSLDMGRVLVDFGEAVVLIVCAFGERFSAITSQGVRLQPHLSPPGTNWAEKAQELAFSNLARPRVSNLMALVLLCEWHIRFGQESAAFMISGIASRLAQLLRLDAEPTEDSLEGMPNSIITAEKESRRRLVWSCYVLDVTISSGVDLISNWPSVPRTRLPCSTREFTLQLECETGTLCEEGLDGDKKYNICLEAYFVRIMYLRKQVLRLIRQDNPTTLSESNHLISSLEECGSSFPRHLQLNEINAYIHEESNQLAAFYALHLLYNQCFCDLYRVTLPGYRFPLSDAISREQPERVDDLRSQCVERAQAITDIIRGALSRGMTGLTDSICSICAYESTKIQIIYARTCMEEGTGDTSLKKNIQTNLQALDIIFGWDKKRDALLSSLSKLLQEFGLLDLATEWLDRNDTSFPSSTKEDGTPESHHLHPLSLYRMTWKEISWPRKLDTNARVQASQFHSIQNTNIASEMLNGVNGDTHAPVNTHPPDMNDSAVESPFNLDELPTAETLMDIDSYLQIADDFSSYLTWDPWDFGYS